MKLLTILAYSYWNDYHKGFPVLSYRKFQNVGDLNDFGLNDRYTADCNKLVLASMEK